MKTISISIEILTNNLQGDLIKSKKAKGESKQELKPLIDQLLGKI
jgi:hypothetical protein